MSEPPNSASDEQQQPTPHLAGVFEWAAAIMGLDHGKERLELVFEDGRLTRWWSHDEANGALELHRFDEDARRLVRAAGEIG